MQRLPRPLALILPLFALALQGCASGPPVVLVDRPRPPDLLLSCRASPPQPEMRTDADLAIHILDIEDAGDDCRSRLDRIREWFDRTTVTPES